MGMIQNAASMSTLATKAPLRRGWRRAMTSSRSLYDTDERLSEMFKLTEPPRLGKEKLSMRQNWPVTFFRIRPRGEDMKL